MTKIPASLRSDFNPGRFAPDWMAGFRRNQWPISPEYAKNQITLPKAIVQKLPATDYFEVGIRGEEIVLRTGDG